MLMQAKLLRVIQEKEIMKVGADKIIPVDVRIIAATNRDLTSMIEEKTFRKDLYYRLKMGYIHIPPLRDRKQDVPLLIRHWLNVDSNGNIQIDEEIMQRFMEHDWPGNVRELQNLVKYALAVCSQQKITWKDLPYGSLMQLNTAKETEAEAPAAKRALPPPDSEISPNSAQQSPSDQLHGQILRLVSQMNRQGRLASRRLLMEQLTQAGCAISSYKLRKVLDELMQKHQLRIPESSYGLEVVEMVESKSEGNK